VVTGLLFLVLLIYEIIWCWLFGIVSSAAFVVLMFITKLYSESILYFIYIFIGVYGWIRWTKGPQGVLRITKAPLRKRMILVGLAALLSVLTGYLFSNYTDANRPYADAGSTVFSLLASYMEANKWLSAWLFWIGINGFSVWLYADRALNLSSMLMVVYFILSIWGFLAWRRKYLKQLNSSL